MYQAAELVLKSYMPLAIEIGMRFVKINPDKTVELFEITKANYSNTVFSDPEEFFLKHGAPVELYVIGEYDFVLATPNQIGWFDPGEESDEYRDIELKDINLILQEHEGHIEIEIEEVAFEYGAINPIIEEGKVIIRPL